MGASTKIQDTNLNITKFACSRCHQEMSLKRIFTLKAKCQDCERSPLAFAKDKERNSHE